MNTPSDRARRVLSGYREAIGPSSAERGALVGNVERAIAAGVGPSALATAGAVGRRTPWLVIVGVGAVVAAGAWWARPNAAPAVVATTAAISTEPIALEIEPATLPSADRAPSPIAIAEPVDVAPAGVIELATKPSDRAEPEKRRPRPAPAIAATEPSTIDAEVALLREASVASKRGDDATARARYEEHARRFPDGALVELREAGLTLLGCRADGDAVDLAARFARRFPDSPHLGRIERECGP